MTVLSFKADIECRDCKGTGLYVGMAERNGSAVVCHSCRGTGCEKFSMNYTPFIARKIRKDVKRVFKSSCGYGHSADKVTLENGSVVHFDQAGAPYDAWLSGSKPKPVKELYCPYLWTNQDLQSESNKQHALYEERCDKQGLLGGLISNCKLFPEKSKCWEIYESLGGK